MNIDLINKIKRLSIIALASDDMLMETLVLKGGNAIDLEVNRSDGKLSRTSFDLDYSIDGGEFNEDENEINARIEKTLVQTFREKNYQVFDYKFIKKPSVAVGEHHAFWGGYNVQFKVIEKAKFSKFNGKIEDIRRNALALNPNNSPAFVLEFSKFEYVGDKKAVDVDGYTVYIYTPEMIVFEKLRAICQQMEGYKEVIPNFHPRSRARDFYDMHLIMTLHDIDLSLPENIELIKNIFEAKRVPTDFIKDIRKYKDFHANNWKDVQSTVSASQDLEDFQYYVDYVAENFTSLKFP